MNENKNVETVWMYVFRSGKMTIHAFTVVEDMWGRKRMIGDKTRRNYPKEFNVIESGTTIFLHDRDDKLVRQMFLEHKTAKIKELQEILDSYKNDITILKGAL